MRLNAEIGSAKTANIKGYFVGGKTGTADKVIHGRYSQGPGVHDVHGDLAGRQAEISVPDAHGRAAGPARDATAIAPPPGTPARSRARSSSASAPMLGLAAALRTCRSSRSRSWRASASARPRRDERPIDRLGDLLRRSRTRAQDRLPPARARSRASRADSRAVEPGFAVRRRAGQQGRRRWLRAAGGRERAPWRSSASARPERRSTASRFIARRTCARALALAAARLLSRASPASIAAVTGTSGKTSVAEFTRQIWARLGHQAAALGTIGVVTPSGATYGSLTTPDPVTPAPTLDRARARGRDPSRDGGVVARARPAPARRRSARGRGLHQSRRATTSTIIRRSTTYLAAKLRLFDTLLPRRRPRGAQRRQRCRRRGRGGGRGARAANRLRSGAKGDELRARSPRSRGSASAHRARRRRAKSFDVRLPLAGDFQVVERAGRGRARHRDRAARRERVFAALERCAGAPGRLERVGERQARRSSSIMRTSPTRSRKCCDACGR